MQVAKSEHSRHPDKVGAQGTHDATLSYTVYGTLQTQFFIASSIKPRLVSQAVQPPEPQVVHFGL